MTDVPRFELGHVLCYRLFDIADEIHLAKVQPLLADDARRLRLRREGSEYLQLPNPPLTVELPPRALALRHGNPQVEVSARLFDHGAASIIFKVPIPPGTTLEDLVPLADELYDSAALDAAATECVEQLRSRIAPALEAPHLWAQNESYTVIFAQTLSGNPRAAEVLATPGLARLLLGESELLSARERQDVLEHQFSYTDSDLVVVDWNAAFVYEPSGSMDIPDLLEIANAQLLEMRYYDDVLDGQLQRVYAEVANKRRRVSLFFSPYRGLSRRLLATLMELSEFIERVENTLKIVGDVYLAKVYEAALRQMRVDTWQASVQRKQRLLGNTYELLRGEVDTDRALSVEVAIVLLIVFEVVMALFTGKR